MSQDQGLPMPLSRVDLAGLAAAGRSPTLPARLAVAGEDLILRESLRLFPGRRLTARARFRDREVIAKLFFRHDKSIRDADHEATALRRLAERGLPVPPLIHDSGAGADGRILLLEVLPGEDAMDVYQRAHGAGDGAAVAARLVAFLARLHDQGCVQRDVHLGNFLFDGERSYLVDAGSVMIHDPLPPALRYRNLGDLLAQFYPLDTLDADALRAAYGPAAPDPQTLNRVLAAGRRRRYRHVLGKIHRDCTDFATVCGGGLSGMASRPLAADMKALLEADPDRIMAAGEMLKDGNSATVCRVRWRDHDWVIKRYNVKSAWHRFKKQFKPSRARRSWRNACWLDLIGLNTPKAVGYAEQRLGGLLDRAYFICRYTPGIPVSLLVEPALSRACREMDRIFMLMERLRFNHGDTKAGNFLWHHDRLWLLDLDAMEIHLSPRQARKAIARDRARWSRNFSTTNKV